MSNVHRENPMAYSQHRHLHAMQLLFPTCPHQGQCLSESKQRATHSVLHLRRATGQWRRGACLLHILLCLAAADIHMKIISRLQGNLPSIRESD